MTPRLPTIIDATGPNGNIMVIVGIARVHMRQLEVAPEEIEAMTARVDSAKTYADALAIVREWFVVDVGDGR